MSNNSKALFSRSIDNKIHKKIDQIQNKTGAKKTVIVEKLLSKSLGVTVKENKLDLAKWLKS
jgi:F0F1-type ATP synthase membrane subunit b/b'